jgi:hypothetical protein
LVRLCFDFKISDLLLGLKVAPAHRITTSNPAFIFFVHGDTATAFLVFKQVNLIGATNQH